MNKDYSTQRLSQRYRFADPNMDLFFSAHLDGGRLADYLPVRCIILPVR